MKKRLLLLYIAVLGILGTASAQNVGLKTNLLTDALASPNIGLEVGLSPKWTLDITGEGNFWKYNRHLWKHWFVQPEARYWFCERFAGHFIGIHAIGGYYNFGNIKNSVKFLGSDFSSLTDHRVQGWGVGGGIAYGYAWVINKHWNIEAEIGVGYIYTRYDKYPCAVCGTVEEKDKPHNYYGPTKAALSFVYLF